ncbi:MAG: DUF6449 domain-containing protein [Bacillota bacterium]|nr:DUF6449 domain-containing protein [Bacillota bacterium]
MRSASLFYSSSHVLRRRIWFSLLLCVAVFLFTMPIAAAFGLEDAADEWLKHADDPAVQAIIANDVNDLFRVTYAGSAIPLILAALFSGLIFFAYLFNRRRVDFYHSLPLRREKLFLANYLAGALAVLLPYLINLLLMLLVTALMGLGSALHFPTILSGMGMSILFFLAIYSTVVLAAMLTGHLVVHVLMSAFLLFFIPAGLVLFYLIFNSFHPSWYVETLNLDQLAVNGSPLLRWIVSLVEGNSYPPDAGTSLLLLGMILLVSSLALLLYKHRPSESAGKALAFPWLRPVIKYPVALYIMAGVSIAFYEIGGKSFAWFLIGAVLSGLISCQALEMLYRFDFSSIRRKFLPGCGLILLFCAICTCGFLDVGGFNSYIPKEEKIERIEVQFHGILDETAGHLYQSNPSYVSYLSPHSNPYYGINTGDGATLDGEKQLRKDVERLTEKDPLQHYAVQTEEGKAAVLELVRSHVERMENGAESYYIDYEYEDENGEIKQGREGDYGLRRFYITVRYELRSGRTVARHYGDWPLYACDHEEAIGAILADESYRHSIYRLFAVPAEQVWIETVTASENSNARDSHYPVSQKSTAHILETMEKELRTLDWEMLRREVPIGQINLRVYAGELPEKPNESYRPYLGYSYYLYPSMQESIAALEELGLGLTAEDFLPNYEEVVSLQLVQHYPKLRYYKASDLQIENAFEETIPAASTREWPQPVDRSADAEQKITDPEEIRYWLDQSFVRPGLVDYDTMREILVTYKDRYGEEYYQTRRLPHPQ